MKIAINNGIVVDPKNKVFSKLNITVENGKICDISNLAMDGDTVIDADGLIVTPGFIDLHIHEGSYYADKKKFDTNIFESMLKMGVTTGIGGNCGIGPERPDEYLDAVDSIGIPINLGLFVPHNILRKEVNQLDKYAIASGDDINKMQQRAAYYLDKGCIGISFGIRYIPGLTKEELVHISKAAKRDNKLLSAHIRDDAAYVMAAAEEFINIGKEIGVPIQISHIGSMAAFGEMERFLSLIDHHVAKGVDISCDCYPYDAFSTGIGETTYDDGFLERYGIGYDRIEIAEGKYRGQRCNEKIFKELRENYPDTITIAHVMREEEVDRALTHPNVIVASDGYLHDGQGHPRASGTFPRIFAKYVKEKRKLNLYEAVEKITSLPAKRLNIAGKGHLGIGADGDIAIFSLDKIMDTATFQEPIASPKGFEYILINGTIALQGDSIVEKNLGKTIRK
ncbi:N-acyl-D-amino-acid deacylase family protein [Natronincola ferrireducens]|uniref:N-acyl-D-amino-acid deacylase n=1 Tax=Natronincola ferrireducens TaxID=393762 RepID=A0A1G9H105_9FIRM|nr:amidohydrolase family protein [Natronincola ferrireducens]SDL06638.1 N-acyl-D-amino-acid deacylase [Natronincola ferrireducens]